VQVTAVLLMVGRHVANMPTNQRRFPDRRIPSRSVFTLIHQTLQDNGCLPGVSLQSETEVVRTFNTRESILQMVQRIPLLSNRKMVCRIGVSRM